MDTPIGVLCIQANDKGITSVQFDVEINSETRNNHTAMAASQLLEYFDLRRTNFTLSLDIYAATKFTQSVWCSLQKIPYGKSISYKNLAYLMGDVNLIRAAANANARNPIAIIVPCHRVIGSNGSMTGYANGIWRKAWLLRHEGQNYQGKLF